MNLPKLLIIVCVVLFGTIGIVAIFKKEKNYSPSSQPIPVSVEIKLEEEVQVLAPASNSLPTATLDEKEKKIQVIDLPDENRIEEFFNKTNKQLPIVETITYKSHVPWLKGRPAWLSDYASHYETSRHFIARSLNEKVDYLKQDISEGDRFNVMRLDKNFEFALVVDTSRCRMWFYYIDLDTHQKFLLKTYQVGLGRVDSSSISGLLTPLGKYTLGDRIAIYKPKVMGIYQNKNTEMLTVFGTRWIPFDKEVEGCTAPAKGFGIHGTPWIMGNGNQLVDLVSGVGKYESDGCIRLATADMEELFAIIITKPTTIEIVRDFFESTIAN